MPEGKNASAPDTPAKPHGKRPAKGSEEAKAWGAEMLEKRLAKLRAQPAHATKPPAPASTMPSAPPSPGGTDHGSAPSGSTAGAPIVKSAWFEHIGLGPFLGRRKA